MAKQKQKSSLLLRKTKLIDLDTVDFQSLYLDTYNRLVILLDDKDKAHNYLFSTLAIIVLNYKDTKFRGLLDELGSMQNGFNTVRLDKTKAFSTFIQHYEDTTVSVTGMSKLDVTTDTELDRLMSSFICELAKECMLSTLINSKGKFNSYALCSAYENLIAHMDSEMQKESGAIYTPLSIANYICEECLNSYVKSAFDIELDEVLTQSDNVSFEVVSAIHDKLTDGLKILEPSMGAGVIFIEMLNVLVGKIVELENCLGKITKTGEVDESQILDIWLGVLPNVYGLDINNTALMLAKNCLLLELYTLGYQGDMVSLDACNIHHVETTLKAKELNSLKFDIVIGNPPYLRSKNISDIDKKLITDYKVYHGNADLLCYFYELGLDLLELGGILGYITSNKWLTSGYGKPLREFILKECEIVGILDFKSNRVFKGVGVDTEITFLRKPFNEVDKSYDFWYCDGSNYVLNDGDKKSGSV